MSIPGRALSVLALVLAFASPSPAQDAEDAYRIRASIYAGKALVTAASWVGVKNRRTTVKQTFTTPYRSAVALSEAGRSADGTLDGEVTMMVRPFEHAGGLCLDVEISSHTVSQLHHYRSESLLEILPGGGGYGAGGDYCDYEETAEGLLFNLSHGDEEDYGEILVRPETPVREDG
ncbi:hypothetical protein [Antarcticirhabdus aurantiaca]|uniref:Uncharacterized protein n=1 Tax=Antarcticirhabdus aurantiaca TaxID=2606717 RepID=A0ACD4NLV8_9HYPH|nr:hypothetical protein [Antarcticirhabdus aurantiaca]WAJ27806.1 hypothetical protein OXU80_23665 [Jeongeuplla avenae]